jgi:Zn-finger nucleic acid-binding protein
MAATIPCPHCGGLTSAESARCARCGWLVQERTARHPDAPIVCPACNSPTEFAWLAGIQIDLCSGCKGVWFDDGELADLPRKVTDLELARGAAELFAGLPPATTVPPRASYLVCPVCARHLAPRNYREVSGILTDRCDGCGTWVDHANLIKILKLIASKQLADVERRRTQMGSPIRRTGEVSGRLLPGAETPHWTPEMNRDAAPSTQGTVFVTVYLLLEILGMFS